VPEVYPFRKVRWLAVLGVVAPAWTDRYVRRFERRVVPEPADGRPRP
jgi:hypothetical protein